MRPLASLAVLAAALAGVLAFPLVSQGHDAKPSATIRFSFQGYANNVRVRPPLVGPWQLGTARIHGSGRLGGAIEGSLYVINRPLFSRYEDHSLRAKVVGYSFFQAAHGAYTKLTLAMAVTSSSRPERECAVGARGTLTLYDSAQPLSNGERSDYVTLHWPAGQRCPSHEQGWTNEDGGARTSPSFGGPPNGGQWAIVRVTTG